MLQIQELWQKPNVVSSLDQSLTSIRGQSARGPALWNQKGFPASKAFNTLFDDNLLFHCTLCQLDYIIIILDYIILDYIILYIIYQKEQLQHYIIYYIYILTKRSALTLSSLSSATLIWT